MRKITNEAREAFDSNINWKKGNTEVRKERYTNTCLYLFKNLIAFKKPSGKIEITDAGYCTATTQERLCGICDVKLRRYKGKWIVNEKEEWDGKWKFIDEFKS